MAEAVGVLDSEAMWSFGGAHSLEYMADTVGDRVVNGMWKDDAQRGVLGTVGNG